MKYKVGDKIKIIRATDGCFGAEGKIGIVTDKLPTDGLGYYSEDGFNVDCGHGHIWKIGFESECELLDDLTVEEAIRTLGTICRNNSCLVCPIGNLDNNKECQTIQRDYPEKVIEILKRWKADHEKKKIETEIVDIIRVMKEEGAATRCVYTYEANEDNDDVIEKMDELVKEYYAKYGGKIYAKFERICRVKS